MNYNFIQTGFFNKEVKRLAKKHKSLKVDLIKLQKDIESDTIDSFDDLGNGLKKIRMQINSKNKGKSGGARIITQEVVIDVSNKNILMVAIWDKSEIDNIKTPMLKKIVQNYFKNL